MSSLFDSMIPSRRREQRRLRDEANRLNERWGDLQISAPNEGCWIGSDRTPDLEGSSPSTQGFASPDVASTLVHNSHELGDLGEQVVIVDTDADPTAQTYHEELEKNAITFTIPLPWPSRKPHSRSASVSQVTAPSIESLQRTSPRPSAPSSVVYKPTSEQYMRELGDISRGNSPAQSVVSSVRHANRPPVTDLPLRHNSPMSSFARRSPSPPTDEDQGPNISAIMLLSPVVEDFQSRSTAASTFSRASSSRNVGNSIRRGPSPAPYRPSTAISSHSTLARSETGTSVSRATAVTEASYYTAITHHTTRSSSRGPGLAHTSTMRSASREPGTRRAMSREPSERRAMSREPTERRAMSREPTQRRAMSREPNRRRAMTGESAFHSGPSAEELRYGASSESGRTSIESDSEEYEASTSEVGRKLSNGSAANGGYYSTMKDEYRSIAWDNSTARSSDSSSLVGRVGKAVKEKTKVKEYSPVLPSKELVPSGDDLYS